MLVATPAGVSVYTLIRLLFLFLCVFNLLPCITLTAVGCNRKKRKKQKKKVDFLVDLIDLL